VKIKVRDKDNNI